MNLPVPKIPKMPEGLKRFFTTMSATVLSLPRRRAEAASTADDNSAGNGLAPMRKLPQPRPMTEWLLMAVLAVLGFALCWLAYAGYALHKSTSEQNSIMMHVPGFDDFLASRPVRPEAGPKKKEDEHASASAHASAAGSAHASAHATKHAAKVEPRSLIEHAFGNFAQFENSRAEFPLRKREAVVAGVQPGSPAQLAGIMPGDLIVSINGKSAGFLWDVFVQLAAKPANTVEIEIKRKDEMSLATLTAPAGAMVDTNSSGMLFDLPEGLHYMGTNDVTELARQFSGRFLEVVPNEWRTEYAGNVDVYSQQLAERISEQSKFKASDPQYLRVEDVLVWQHENFMLALEHFTSEQRNADNQVGLALDRLGNAVLVTAIAMLLVLLAGVGLIFGRRSH